MYAPERGGANPAGRLDFEPDPGERGAVGAADEKDRIALAALAELPDGGSVVLDAGSTVARLADSAKAGQEHFARVGSFADVRLLITDTGLAPADKAAIEAAGTEAELV